MQNTKKFLLVDNRKSRSTTSERKWSLEFTACKQWKTGIRTPDENRREHKWLLCVSLSSLKNAMLPLLHEAMKINYLTCAKYHECVLYSVLINQNASTFNIGQLTVFRSCWVYSTIIKTDWEAFWGIYFPQNILYILELVIPSLHNFPGAIFTMLDVCGSWALELPRQVPRSLSHTWRIWIRNIFYSSNKLGFPLCSTSSSNDF